MNHLYSPMHSCALLRQIMWALCSLPGVLNSRFVVLCISLLLATAGGAFAQTLQLEATANKSNILTGESFTYTFKYTYSSTSSSCTSIRSTSAFNCYLSQELTQ